MRSDLVRLDPVAMPPLRLRVSLTTAVVHPRELGAFERVGFAIGNTRRSDYARRTGDCFWLACPGVSAVNRTLIGLDVGADECRGENLLMKD